MDFLLNFCIIIIFLYAVSIMASDMVEDTKKGISLIKEKAMPNATILGKAFLLIILGLLSIWKNFFLIMLFFYKAMKKPLATAGKIFKKLFSVIFIKKKVV